MKRLAFCALLAIAAAAPVTAQGVPLVHFGIMGGYSLPYSTVKDYAKSGWGGGITLSIGAPLVPVSFRVDATYNLMDGKTLDVAPLTTAKNDFTVWTATGNVLWTIIGNTLPTKFYLIAGLGYYNVGQKVTVTASPLPPVGTTITSSKFGYNAGVGVRFTKLFVEARWNTINGGLTLLDGSTTSLQFIPITVGLMF